jgi:hypothetical protein
LGELRLLNIKALNLSLKASLIQKFYLNPKWFSSRLLRKAHPLFKNDLFAFVQIAMFHFLLIEMYLSGIAELATIHPPEKIEQILEQILWLMFEKGIWS